ncbi:senescence-specific cysteine protease SAG39-like [Impatiens glandulifera]|uniref:senescence-specific cysteine protease SAG39-like n=1 Tax=Impatiens glandulifera TaxID=253017 RepID=UPI001FB1780D|nr:senescence-specific cysteine protease SAG39-like [Impatiens glandulifera]
MDSKTICLFFLFVLAAISSLTESRKSFQEASLLARQHDEWMGQYGRVYENDVERQERFNIFKENIAHIESFNRAADKPYKLGVNQFADLTNEEFKARNGYRTRLESKVTSKSLFKYKNNSFIPSKVDWRNEGVVTPVKNQGTCGCCWAFSAVAAMEGITMIKTGQLMSLSEQELIDCDVNGPNKGCRGGYMNSAFDFIQNNDGLTTESNYPYVESSGTCNNLNLVSAATITGHEDVPTNDEKALQKAVAKQPVSVAMDAGNSNFRFYSSGVYTGECGTDLNHAVTAVGYGVDDNGTKYWLIKNSWGTSWGEEGYIRMERFIEAKEGLCGIAMIASYPTA